MGKKAELTTRLEDFCQLYLHLGSPGEAARLAGWPGKGCEKTGLRLLSDPAVRKRVETLREAERQGKRLARQRESAISGLCHAALSGCGDALRLLCMDDETLQKQAGNLDLFCVSEIKRQKGGTTEIKFLDRIKALEAVCRLTEDLTEESGAADLIRAVQASTGGWDTHDH